jgi:hypothetical protein
MPAPPSPSRSHRRRVVAEFRCTFILSSTAALLAAIAVVALVAQTGPPARQRAQFAAAAARAQARARPLRLHAEMLAEGSGGLDHAASYAARIVPEVAGSAAW